MRKTLVFLTLAVMFTLCLGITVYAGVTIDTDNVSKGLVVVKLTDLKGKTILAQIEKGSEKYNYSLIKDTVNLPLQMGTGDYKISVLENVGGDKYKPLSTATVNVKEIDEAELYKMSNPFIEYSVSTKAIPAFKKLTEDKKTTATLISTVYGDIVKNYAYDLDKAAKVAKGYVPVIDDVYAAKKGICFDYAALLGGALRSQGIPTRMVMGYVPEISDYHAWNEILVDGEWVAVDATYDAQVVKAGKQYTMQKDKSKTTVVKKY